MSRSLLPCIDKITVSSILNNDISNYGKHHLIDGSEETCWNSDAGSPQKIRIAFKEAVCVKRVDIMFQGGFVGQSCQLFMDDVLIGAFVPQDIVNRTLFV